MAAYHSPTVAGRPVTGSDPLILLVPDDLAQRDSEWLTRWEREIPDCRRLDLGLWDSPHRNTWVNKINLAVHLATRPVILVAHGLGCVAVAWWAEFERPGYGDPVAAALMVAPPDVDRPGTDARLARFCSCPRQPLPFTTVLVADQHRADSTRSTWRRLSQDWNSSYIETDDLAAQGDWPTGRRVLDHLTASLAAKGVVAAAQQMKATYAAEQQNLD